MPDSVFRSFLIHHSDAIAKSEKRDASAAPLVFEKRLAASCGPSSRHDGAAPLKRLTTVRNARDRCAIAPMCASLRSYRSALPEPPPAIARQTAQLIAAVITTAIVFGHAKTSAASAINDPMMLMLAAMVCVLPDCFSSAPCSNPIPVAIAGIPK